MHAHTYTHTCTCIPKHRQKISATTPRRFKQYYRRTYASIYICMHIHTCTSMTLLKDTEEWLLRLKIYAQTCIHIHIHMYTHAYVYSGVPDVDFLEDLYSKSCTWRGVDAHEHGVADAARSSPPFFSICSSTHYYSCWTLLE